ncbi:MAG: type II toxin-antitoxin system RelE/ParE family toxin [Rhizobiaceae bacterium]|nr:type II toxin-antitoxin system RelE/ParE family toxin [Rhizobiaceae bacterium]
MKIIFTVEAKADLDELHGYLAPLSPSGLARVVAAIEKKIILAAENPSLGRPSPRIDVRELVEPKYGFLIPYYVKHDVLFVLRIYRGHRDPLDYEKLEVAPVRPK